jgi:hypothetical protein
MTTRCNVETVLAEWNAIGASCPLPREVAEIILNYSNRVESAEPLTIEMPSQIASAEVNCPPRRYERKQKANAPAGPSLSKQRSPIQVRIPYQN